MTMTTCTGNDALLQVEYTLTQDEYTASRGFIWEYDQFYPFLIHQGNEVRYGKFETADDSEVYETPPEFKDLTNYEACVPTDDCNKIVVGGIPTDGFKLSFDGEVAEIGHEYYFDGVNPVTYTEVGNCTKSPVCNDAEALFELQYWSGSVGYQHEFRLDDKDGNSVQGGALGDRYNLTKSYACLPKDDACYTFLIGSRQQRDPLEVASSSYSVFFDGKLVGNSNSWLLDSVQFGGSCGPLCNPQAESFVEFFMYDDRYPEVEYEYKWNLNSTSTSLSGVVPSSTLFHKTMCVPKDSCVSFNIETRYEETDEFHLAPAYTLAMDNITYRKNVEWFPTENGHLDQTTNMGVCTATDLCDVQTEDLFQFEQRTPATSERTNGEQYPTVSLPMIPAGDRWWNFGYTYQNDWDLKGLLRNSHYVNLPYDLDAKYAVIECVPKEGCDLSFNFTPSIESSSTLKKNGVQLDSAQSVGYEYFSNLMTPFGENCVTSSSNAVTLSGGAIAGIVVAFLLGLK